MAEPRVETSASVPPSNEETALAQCVAPIDPTVFSGDRNGRKTERVGGEAPQKPALLDPDDRCGQAPTSAECAYREARTHFEQQRFDLAAKGFRKLALDGDVDELGLFAAQLALESLNILGTHAEPPRQTCAEVIASDTDALIDRYCRRPIAAERQESCGAFFRIARDVRLMNLQQLINKADRGGPDDPVALYEQAGDAYRALFDEACPPAAKPNPVLEARCDELLFSAERAYRAAGAREKAEAAYRTFFDPRAGLESSPLAEKLAAPRE